MPPPTSPLSPAASTAVVASVAGAAGRWVDRLLDPSVLDRLGWALVHFLWQGATVAAALAVALAMLRHRSAAARYRTAFAALSVLAAAPIVTFCAAGGRGGSEAAAVPITSSAAPVAPPVVTSAVASGAVTASQHSETTAPAGHPADRRPNAVILGPPLANDVFDGADLETAGASPYRVGPVGLPITVITTSAVRPTEGPTEAMTVPSAARPAGHYGFGWVVLAWAAGVAALSAWRVGGWFHLRLRLRQTTPVPDPWPRRLRAVADRLGVRRVVRLAEAAWVGVPAVVGVVRPVLLLPAAALTRLTPTQLEAILAHELAHVRRRDPLANLLQAVVETALFYHPAVWWTSARVREEREHGCDDLAAAACPSPADYADALAAMELARADAADRRGRSLPAHLALAAGGGGRSAGPLLRRVRRVLGLPPGPRDTAFRHLGAAAVMLGCAALPLAADHVARARADGAALARPLAALPVAESVAAPTAGGPATRPSDSPPPPAVGDPFAAIAVPPEPADAVATPRFPVAVGEGLVVEVSDPEGPGTATSAEPVRVGRDGAIRLAKLPAPIRAAGRTELELQRSVRDAYRAAGAMTDPMVRVTTTEPLPRRTFAVRGDVGRPGEQPLPRPDFRLFDALAATGCDAGPGHTVYVVREPPPAGPTDFEIARRRSEPLARLQGRVASLAVALTKATPRLGEDHPAVEELRRELESARADLVAATEAYWDIEPGREAWADRVEGLRRTIANWERQLGEQHPTVAALRQELAELDSAASAVRRTNAADRARRAAARLRSDDVEETLERRAEELARQIASLEAKAAAGRSAATRPAARRPIPGSAEAADERQAEIDALTRSVQLNAFRMQLLEVRVDLAATRAARRRGGKVLAVPMSQLRGGQLQFNVVIRSGDAVVVRAPGTAGVAATAPSAAPAWAGQASAQVTVRDLAGKPVVGAQVRLVNGPGGAGWAIGWEDWRTDTDGHYLLERLSPGARYAVIVESPGYVTAEVRLPKLNPGKRVDLEPIVLERPEREIAGRVVSPDGSRPVAGAIVTFLQSLAPPATRVDGEAQPWVATGADGRFRFAVPASARGVLYATAVDGKLGADEVPVRAGDTDVTLFAGPGDRMDRLTYRGTYLWIRLGEATAEDRRTLSLADGVGVRIMDVFAFGPAERAGLRAGDVLIRWGDDDLWDTRLRQRLAAAKPGDAADLTVRRGDQTLHVRAVLTATAPTPPFPPAADDNAGGRATSRPAADAIAPAVAPTPATSPALIPFGPPTSVKPATNIAVRPVRLVVAADGSLTLDGERATWADLPARFAKAAAERRTVLAVVPASDDLTLRQLSDAERQATALALKFGFTEVGTVMGSADRADDFSVGPATRSTSPAR